MKSFEKNTLVLGGVAVVLAALATILVRRFYPANWWVLGGVVLLFLLVCIYDAGWFNKLGHWMWKKISREPKDLPGWVYILACYMAMFGFFLLVASVTREIAGPPEECRVDKERFVAAEDYHVLEAYLDGYVSLGDFYDTSWLAVYPYLEGCRLSDKQLAVITYYAMWCGDDFAKMPVATILMKKEEIIGCDFIAPFDSGHKLWILRAVWDGELSLKELRNFPHGSCYLIDADELKYDPTDNCRVIMTKELRKRLETGPLTAAEILTE